MKIEYMHNLKELKMNIMDVENSITIMPQFTRNYI